MEDEWIDWMGDTCPVPGETTIDVRLRSGMVMIGVKAGDVFWGLWNHELGGGDIVAYRVVSP